TIDTGGGPDGHVTGEGGFDTLTYANRPAGDDVTVELRPSIHALPGGGVESSNPHADESDGSHVRQLDLSEQVIGGAGNDVIIGGLADNTLIGGPGADILCGGLGNDTVDYSDEPGPEGVDVPLDGTPAAARDPTVPTSAE